jgi:uncharacterized Zn-binding protein involved in type VI secretion
MSAPVIVMGDRVVGICPNHLIPNPVGGPMPSPPLPFSAPLTLGLVTTVLAGGKPVAVMGSSGFNTPPHVGLYPADPFLAPPMQKGQVLSGSPTVLIGGQPAASALSSCTCCLVPGNLVPTVTTVLIG